MLEYISDESDKMALEEFIYNNPELEDLEELVDDFNIFTALGIVNNEIRHSTFLAWLLNPYESHGLGDYFLSLFLKKVAYEVRADKTQNLSIFDMDSWNFDDAEVLREWRNIDIFIKSDAYKLVCVIENKVYASEGEGQLEKYKKIVEHDFPDYKKLFVYLTVDKDLPTVDDYIPLSHGEIIPLIEHLLYSKTDKIGTEISTFISHYYDILRRYIMENSGIQTICRSIYKKHKRALDLIFEYKPDRQMEIYECLKEIIADREGLILEYSNKSIIRFISRNFDFIPLEGNWLSSKRMLIFELINNTKSVTLYLIIYPGTQDMRKEIYSLAQSNPTLFNMIKNRFTERFTGIYKKQILALSEYEDKEIDDIKRLLNERIQEFTENDLPKIVNVMKQFEVSQSDQKE